MALLGREYQGPVVVLDRPAVLAHGAVGGAAIIEGIGILWVDRDRVIVILYREIILTLVVKRIPSVLERRSQVLSADVSAGNDDGTSFDRLVWTAVLETSFAEFLVTLRKRRYPNRGR